MAQMILFLVIMAPLLMIEDMTHTRYENAIRRDGGNQVTDDEKDVN